MLGWLKHKAYRVFICNSPIGTIYYYLRKAYLDVGFALRPLNYGHGLFHKRHLNPFSCKFAVFLYNVGRIPHNVQKKIIGE